MITSGLIWRWEVPSATECMHLLFWLLNEFDHWPSNRCLVSIPKWWKSACGTSLVRTGPGHQQDYHHNHQRDNHSSPPSSSCTFKEIMVHKEEMFPTVSTTHQEGDADKHHYHYRAVSVFLGSLLSAVRGRSQTRYKTRQSDRRGGVRKRLLETFVHKCCGWVDFLCRFRVRFGFVNVEGTRMRHELICVVMRNFDISMWKEDQKYEKWWEERGEEIGQGRRVLCTVWVVIFLHFGHTTTSKCWAFLVLVAGSHRTSRKRLPGCCCHCLSAVPSDSTSHHCPGVLFVAEVLVEVEI